MEAMVLKKGGLRALLLVLLLPVMAWGGANTPRFMVMIDEKNLGAYTVAESENVITEYLLNKDLDVVDAELVKVNIDRDKALQAMTAGPRAAASLGLQFGAEIIIVGKAVAKGSAERIKDTSFRSYQAQVSLKAIRTDTAEIQAFESGSAAKIHVDDAVGGSEAIRAATNTLVEPLISKVLANWEINTQRLNHKIQLVVGGVYHVWQVAAIKKILRSASVPGITEVIQRSFVSGIAVFDVKYDRESQKLAEDLTLVNPDYFSLKIVGITPNKLDMKLIDKGS